MKLKALAVVPFFVALSAAPAMSGTFGDAVVEMPVDDTVVVVPPPVGFGGLGVGGAVAAGVVGAVALAALLNEGSGSVTTTTTPE